MKKKPILIVEDDDSIREVLLDILQGEGFESLSAVDGCEALELLTGGLRPCWILMDITMPRMSGIECLEILKKNEEWSPIPVTLISAGARAQVQADLLQVDYLNKPIDIDVLLKTARKYYC